MLSAWSKLHGAVKTSRAGPSELHPNDMMPSSRNPRHSPPRQHEWVQIEDPNLKVTLPTLQYGYRTTKMSWADLQQIIQTEQNLAKLSRSEDQQRRYQVFRHYLLQQYHSTLDFLLISNFGIPSTEDCGGKLKAAITLSEMKDPMTRLVPNDFPYFVEDNIHHFLYWKTKEAISETEISTVQETLQKEYMAVDILYWINPPSHQSLPEIDHVHFLFRTQSNT